MTKEQIEAQSNLIQACKMIGATFKGDTIEFASGLVAQIYACKGGVWYQISTGVEYVHCKLTWDARSIYKKLIQFLYEAE